MRKGRFRKALAQTAARYSESISFDRRLYRHDIAGSIAHAAALADAGIISAAEKKKIEAGLREIEKEIKFGKFSWDHALEDVHMNIESALTEKIGQAGARLHTARSRNDQVALDLRLYVKEEIPSTSARLGKLQRALLKLAQKQVDLVMPGYTHLQRAQPIPFAHYLLGQIEAFARDAERLRDCLQRTDVLPLGSGALAGSTISLDRELIARELGFARVSQNSLDAVSDRDFVCEFIFCLAMIGMHLSRLSEDLILWSTSEFGFVEFSEHFSTGSSLMPQKKNPDMAELTRGKTGRLYLFAAMLPELKINRERMKAAASDPDLLATDLAEYLVKKGMPFREAHETVGRLVADVSKKGVKLNALKTAQLKKFSPLFDVDVAKIFDVRRSLAARTGIGAPSQKNVRAQIARWQKELR